MNHAQVAQFAERQGLLPMSPSQYTPAIDPEYVFRPELVIEMIGFLKMTRAKAMKVTGVQGSGKTTLVTQFHAALGWPLLIFQVRPETTSGDLLGRYKRIQGDWVFGYGPVTLGAKMGCSVLLDEYNLMQAEEASGTNMLLDGQAVDIEENGERIVPHPSFKVFATENPADISRGFLGRNEQDAANSGRFWTVEVAYARADVEKKLVQGILEKFLNQDDAEQYAANMVDVANRVRAQSVAVNPTNGALEITFPTRSLLMWAEGLGVFGEAENPLHFTLQRALTSQARPDTGTKAAIHEIVADVFGVAYS